MKRKLLECGGLTPPSSARLDSPNGFETRGVEPPRTARLRQAAALQRGPA